MSLPKNLLNKLIDFRRQLHQFPELSGNENITSKAIADFIAPTKPTEVIDGLGGNGIAFLYNTNSPGPTVLLRADMDALPIQELNSFNHKSTVLGVAHLCGHDGHSAILAGVAHSLNQISLSKGKVVLLFQPAEETGQGAAAVIADPKFGNIKPDYAFALHNLPGYKKGDIFLRNSTFASASTGLIANIKGLSSHAAHPEDGNNPDRALAQMILGLNYIANEKGAFNDFALLTVIHAKLGEVAFGTTPGNATLMATLRTYLDSDMGKLKKMVENHISAVCKEHKLTHSVTYVEEFLATINNEDCVNLIKTAAIELGLNYQSLERPFRWSEDFGHFTQISKAALFGVGSGVNHPNLHNEDYDFPDDIIEPSIATFMRIIEKLLS
ncbi:MAG TPA: amidohydrolase [Bacteroidales bacterium]|nr:amidohydrolase [Bacteroidales bacterium]